MFGTPTIAHLALLAAGYYFGPAGTNHRWSQGALPVEYCLTSNATSTPLSAAEVTEAVHSAVAQWIGVSAGGPMGCSTFDTTPSTGLCSTDRANDGTNNVYWVKHWDAGSQVIAVTYSTFAGTCGTLTDIQGQRHPMACTLDADIEFNDRDFTWTNTGISGTDIASIAAHEFGHFLGLEHCNVNGTCQMGSAVMNAYYAGGSIRVPHDDDVAGACLLYPSKLARPTVQNVVAPLDGGICACDTSSTCDPACDCDQDCGQNRFAGVIPTEPDAGGDGCACDLTYGCDPKCSCDPECRTSESHGCTCLTPAPGPAAGSGGREPRWWSALALSGLVVGMLGTRRFLR